MDLVQRMCDHVAIVAAGRLLVAGTVDDVRAGQSLQDRFVELVGGRRHTERAGMVATLLRLRFRVLGNQLARSPWQLVGFIFGAIYGLGLLAGIAVGLVLLGFGDLRAGEQRHRRRRVGGDPGLGARSAGGVRRRHDAGSHPARGVPDVAARA